MKISRVTAHVFHFKPQTQQPMPDQKILPSTFTEISVEHILRKYSRTPKIIYWSVLILFVAGFVSMFFIHVDVSVRAQGILRTSGERVFPKATGTGYIKYINPSLRENAIVTAGDTLIIIGRDTWGEQLQAAQQRMEELNDLLADLAILVNIPYRGAKGNFPPLPNLKTALYQQSFELFRRRNQNNLQLVATTRTIYNRDRQLFTQRVVAQEEMERSKAEFDRAMATLSTLYNEQMSQWHTEKQRYLNEQLELQSRINQLRIQKQELVVIASTSGSVQQLRGLRVGSFITEGEILMEVSPEGNLYAEAFVSPRDIGLIRIGQRAMLQIDAFNFNQWGMLEAEVIDIAHDINMFEGTQVPFFRVLGLPERDYMMLRNGYQAELMRGMTFTVRFVVARRTTINVT
ncbi:MAG: HlyD family secretion protein [Bacteroidales bacterium]|nr:HlyD family secretion protein [Bacteroidales bacterium]